MENKFFLAFLALLYYSKSFGQHYPDFELLRYLERYDSLFTDTSISKNDFYRKLKFTPLGKSPNYYVSFGGDYRFQYYYDINEQWGDVPQDIDGHTKSRLLLHSNWQLSNRFRAFFGIQSSLTNGRIDPIPIDENPLEVHQSFVDLLVVERKKVNIKVRVGRQEMIFGSQRFVTVREGANNRQTFDGFHSIITLLPYLKTNLFLSTAVQPKLGIFDDQFFNLDTKFWGNYWSYTKFQNYLNIDLYYFGLDRKNSKYDNAEGKELRHTVGTRLWKSKGKWRFDAEFNYQFGTIANQTISAYASALNTTYTFKHKLQPIIGVKTEIISGDRNKNDDQLNSFNPLFPRGGYYGFIPMVGPVNIIDFHPSFSINILPKLNYYLEYNVFYRTSIDDGSYTPSGRLQYSNNNSNDRYIGFMLYNNLVYQANKNLSFTTEISWFKPKNYLKAVSAGKNSFTFDIQIQFTF